MKQNKKPLIITLASIDVGLTLFLFAVSIIMLVTNPGAEGIKEIRENGAKNFIQWFQANPTAYLFIGVVPLFLLLAVNVIVLVRFVKKISAKKEVQLNELSDAEKAALKEELLKDLNK